MAGEFGMHDIAEGSSFQCQSDLLRGHSWVGGKDDWLVTLDPNLNLALVNLINTGFISLPSLAVVPLISNLRNNVDYDTNRPFLKRALRRTLYVTTFNCIP